jgi:predicted ATPase
VLGTALIAAKGFAAPEAGDAYTRACELGRELGDIPKFLEALYGQFVFHWQRAELDAAHEVGRNLLRLAEEQSDGDAKVVGHRIFAAYLFPLGKFCESRDRAEAAIALYDPDHDQSRRFYSFDSRVICLDWLAHALLILGYPDDARKRSNEALDSATKLAHPTTMAAALIRNCTLHLLLRDRRAAQAQADELIELTKEQGSRQRLAEGRVIRGWTLTPGGDKTEGIADITEGIAEIRQGLRDYRATGAELFSPYFLALLAEALRWAGRSATGLRMLRVVLHRLKLTRLRWIESELHRLRGELQLALPKPDQSEAEASFSRALAVASEQQAKFWELRAATSLARLWRDQRRRNEAHDLLAPIYGWFRQGFDTADLKDAKALLDELG